MYLSFYHFKSKLILWWKAWKVFVLYFCKINSTCFKIHFVIFKCVQILFTAQFVIILKLFQNVLSLSACYIWLREFKESLTHWSHLYLKYLRTGRSHYRLGTHIIEPGGFLSTLSIWCPFVCLCSSVSLFLTLSLPFTSWKSPNCWQLFGQQQAIVVNVYRASKWAGDREGACVCWMLMKSRCWVSVGACGCVCVCVSVCVCVCVCAWVRTHARLSVCICVSVYMFAPLLSPNRWVLLVSQHLIGQHLLINNMQAVWCS